MKNTTNTGEPRPASLEVPPRKDWTTPVVDTLELAEAETGFNHPNSEGGTRTSPSR